MISTPQLTAALDPLQGSTPQTGSLTCAVQHTCGAEGLAPTPAPPSGIGGTPGHFGLEIKIPLTNPPISPKKTPGLDFLWAIHRFCGGSWGDRASPPPPKVMGRLACTLAALLFLQAVSCAVRPEEASHSRIVGGIDALLDAWPWQVSVMVSLEHVCGGTLIDSTHILSAAHCFPSDNNHKWSMYKIMLGAYQLDVPDSNSVMRRVSKVVTYPGYVEGGSGDIAVATLESPVPITDNIKPIPLPCSTTVFPVGMKCMITGWGHIGQSISLPSPRTLQVAEVPLISQRTCKCLYIINPSTTHTQEIMPDMICAGLVAGGRDACQGDSGGPLSCKVGDVYYQAGIVSWGDECGAPNRVGVYTMTSSYADWILQNAPGAQVSCPTIDIAPDPEVDGCMDAGGNYHPNGASTLVLVAASLPFYFLTVYLLSAL